MEVSAPHTYGDAKSSPDQMPELPREITILNGAFTSLEMRVNELLEKLSPVTRPSEPTPESLAAVGPDQLPVTTEYAAKLREIQQGMSRLESRVTYATNRLEL